MVNSHNRRTISSISAYYRNLHPSALQIISQGLYQISGETFLEFAAEAQVSNPVWDAGLINTFRKPYDMANDQRQDYSLFWSNPRGHHVDLLLILLTRNKLSLSCNVFVNNVSHQQHLKNRYIFQLAIIIDTTRFHFLQQFCVNVFPKTTFVHHFIGFFAIYTCTRYFLQNKMINYCYQR